MKKVMIVDDSALTRQLVRAALSMILGTTTQFAEAEDGAAALKHLVAKPVDLIVCDLNMPVLDGHGLIARVRNMGHHRSTPVIVLSSLVNDAKTAQLKAAGANVVLKKPFTNQQIRDSLRVVGLG